VEWIRKPVKEKLPPRVKSEKKRERKNGEKEKEPQSSLFGRERISFVVNKEDPQRDYFGATTTD
jgi:hypothetical protein